MTGIIKKSNDLLLILIVLSLFSNRSSAISTIQSIPLAATEILKKVEKKYSGLTSYRNKGSVIEESGIVKFETYFPVPIHFFLNAL